MRLRNSFWDTSRISISPKRIAPSVTSKKRGSKLTNVVLPEPVDPIKATVSSGLAVK